MLDAGVGEPRPHHAVEHGELEVRVPLDGQLIVRDRRRRSSPARSSSAPRRAARREPGPRRRRTRRSARAASAATPGTGSGRGSDRHACAGRRCGTTRRRPARSRGRRSASVSSDSPSRTRSRGSDRCGSSPGGHTSNSGRELSTGYCHTIQSERGPVSPSGMLLQAVTQLGRHRLEHCGGAAERHTPHEENPAGRRAFASVRTRAPPFTLAWHLACFVECPAALATATSETFASRERQHDDGHDDRVSGRLTLLPSLGGRCTVRLAAPARGRRDKGQAERMAND